jgi:hypothetical protein
MEESKWKITSLIEREIKICSETILDLPANPSAAQAEESEAPPVYFDC